MTKGLLQKIINLPGWLSQDEGLLLYQLTKKVQNRGRIVEIGSFMGKSTAFIASACKEMGGQAMFAVDPHLGITHEGKKEFKQTFSDFKKNIEKLGLSDFVSPIRKTSQEAARTWQGKISLLNVDGLHEYKYVKQDLQLWLPKVVDGGYVVCHDAFSPEPDVSQAITEEIFNKSGFCWVGVSESQIFALKGKPKSVLQRLNLWRSKFFITFALNILQNKNIPSPLRYIIVNRILKPMFMNSYMFAFQKKRISFFQLALILLGGLYIVSRLVNLEMLPITNDEANYLYWAKIIATTNKHWFIILTAGKPVLPHWLMVVFIKLLPAAHYLAAGRLESVVGGAIGMVGIFKFSQFLFKNRRISLIATMLFVLNPFILFYDRLALFDSLLSSMLIWATYFCFKTASNLRYKTALLWGIFLGLAFQSKPTAILFFVLLPICFLILRRPVLENIKRKINLLLISGLVSQIIHFSLIVSRGFWDYLPRSLDYHPSSGTSLQQYIALFNKNLIDTFNWIIPYYTLPFFVIGILGFVILYRKSKQRFLVISVLYLIPILIFCLFGRIYFPRYFLFTTPYFLIATALAMSKVATKWERSLKTFVLFIFILMPQIFFDFAIVANPPSAPLPTIEQWQYITGYPSSYGFDPLYEMIGKQLAKGPVVLVVHGGFSHYPNAFRLKFYGNNNLRVFEGQDIHQLLMQHPQSKTSAKVLVVLHDDDDNNHLVSSYNLTQLRIITVGRKPGGRNNVYLAEFIN